MDEVTAKVKNRMIDKIKGNGHDVETVRVVQKALDAWLCTVTFADDDAEYHGVVTRAEIEAQ